MSPDAMKILVYLANEYRSTRKHYRRVKNDPTLIGNEYHNFMLTILQAQQVQAWNTFQIAKLQVQEQTDT